MANMLGDPDFPKYTLEKYKQSMTFTYQMLYQRASRLQLSYSADRWLSISALEARLLGAFRTRGGYGVFEVELGRSLLWRRSNKTEKLIPVALPPHQLPIPSWSCLAYMGEIGYLDLPRRGISWSTNIKLCYPDIGEEYQQAALPTALTADSWHYDGEKITVVHYDVPSYSERPGQICVVVGVNTETKPRAYYLLLIAMLDGETWQRVGVALAEGDDLFSSNPTRQVLIL
jgi:hypothetical protein